MTWKLTAIHIMSSLFLHYLSGSGGFGGGLESRNILSILCDVRRFFCCDCSRMSRSRGVNGISGSEVR